MAERLKRWESPRRQGRNDKGKGGSARQRQLKKQQQVLRKRLKVQEKAQPHNQNKDKEGRDANTLPSFLAWVNNGKHKRKPNPSCSGSEQRHYNVNQQAEKECNHDEPNEYCPIHG
jgi:hypothetical protein